MAEPWLGGGVHVPVSASERNRPPAERYAALKPIKVGGGRVGPVERLVSFLAGYELGRQHGFEDATRAQSRCETCSRI